MESEAAKQYVDALLDYQFDLLWCRQFGVNHAEFIFAQTVDAISKHPELRTWFIQLVQRHIESRTVVDGSMTKRPKGFVDREFILYVVHSTRWPEFSALASQISRAPTDVMPDNPALRWSSEISGALSDVWPDREFYVWGKATNVV
jgi:hypothetical protein